MSDIKIKPSVLPGFLDLLPKEQLAFNAMLRTIQDTFELYGFTPMDTPIIEKAEILMAKGGEEAEKQTYQFKKGDNDLALRFDLTVPLARFVSEHFNDLHFPFRRYQIGKVYRGEKPQKGRFREFYQCDIDIIGRDTLDNVNDAEILATMYAVFSKLNIGKFVIKINNRKLLTGFLDELKLLDKATEVLRIIDKLDKIGEEKVIESLKEIGLSQKQTESIIGLIKIQGTPESVLNQLQSLAVKSSIFNTGLHELTDVTNYINLYGVPENGWKIDLTIARGLDYYTGTVYETYLVDNPQLGSICSGGRYDNLAEYYTTQKLPGVGISMGFSRLFYQLNELGLVNKGPVTPTKFIVVPLEGALKEAFNVANIARNLGIPSEVYTDEKSTIKKKLDYANKMGIAYVGIIGENELKENKVTIKNMASGEQQLLSYQELANFIK